MTDPIERVAPALEATLHRFTPVEVGWILAEHATDLPGHPYRIYPLLGWAEWDVTEGDQAWREVTPITGLLDFDYSYNRPMPEVYYSRALHREAQGNVDLALSRAQLRHAVGE